MKMKILFTLIFSLMAVVAWAFDLKTSDIGAVADGQILCTQQLQKAIDQISEKGGGRLVFTSGRYLTGSLRLRSNVVLHFDKDAVLLGSTNPYDYEPMLVESTDDKRADNASMALIISDGAENIGITGLGTIDGQGLQLALNIDSLHHTGERVDANYNTRRLRPSELARPKLLFFHKCKDVRIEDLHFRSSANWGLSFALCKQIRISNIDVENRAYWNNDGIDLSDCQNVLVDNCRINSADDGICMKSYHRDACCRDIEISRCHIRSSASAVKFGTASWGGFQNVHIHDIKVEDTFRSAIAIESVDGGQIDSVIVERIDAKNTANPIFIRLGQRAGEQKGSLRHVVIRDLVCEVPFGRPDEAYDLRGPEVDYFHNPFPSSICGIPGNYIEDVTIEDVSIRFPGRATRGMAYVPLWRLNDVPEQVAKSPEFTMFGELPAWAFYVRHVRGITFRRVRLSLSDADFRPAFVLDDVHDVICDDVQPSDASQWFDNQKNRVR